MPETIAGLVWIVGGGLMVVLLALVGWFAVQWMARHDGRVDQLGTLVADHDKSIAVCKADQAAILGRLDNLAGALERHISSEEGFWQSNQADHQALHVAIASLGASAPAPPVRAPRKRK